MVRIDGAIPDPRHAPDADSRRTRNRPWSEPTSGLTDRGTPCRNNTSRSPTLNSGTCDTVSVRSPIVPPRTSIVTLRGGLPLSTCSTCRVTWVTISCEPSEVIHSGRRPVTVLTTIDAARSVS